MPHSRTNIIEEPSGDHLYGIRVIDQVLIMLPATALAKAIHRAIGVRLHELLMTPERLHWALQQAGIMAYPETRR